MKRDINKQKKTKIALNLPITYENNINFCKNKYNINSEINRVKSNFAKNKRI